MSGRSHLWRVGGNERTSLGNSCSQRGICITRRCRRRINPLACADPHNKELCGRLRVFLLRSCRATHIRISQVL